MAEKPRPKASETPPKSSGHDEPVKIDLDPEVALRALLQVEPEPVDPSPPHGDPLTE